MSYNDATPNLASVLSILASLTPSNDAEHNQVPLPIGGGAVSTDVSTPSLPQQWQQSHSLQSQPPSRSTFPSQAQPVKLVDPATIIDWSSGLRCVMKTVAKQEEISIEIGRMIKNQHDHETLWFKARQDLIERQHAREESGKKLDEVLKSVGGYVAEERASVSPEAMKEELNAYDMKIYRAQVQMVKEMTVALKRLGVPFFGTRTELVRVSRQHCEKGASTGTDPAAEGMIDEMDLTKLQRKMLGILEDLCNCKD